MSRPLLRHIHIFCIYVRIMKKKKSKKEQKIRRWTEPLNFGVWAHFKGVSLIWFFDILNASTLNHLRQMFPIIQKPVNWFTLQINWMVSIWWRTLVVNGLTSYMPFFVYRLVAFDLKPWQVLRVSKTAIMQILKVFLRDLKHLTFSKGYISDSVEANTFIFY